MPYLTLPGSKSFLMENKAGKLRAGWIRWFAQGHKQVDLWVGTEIRHRLCHWNRTVAQQQGNRRAGTGVAPGAAPQTPPAALPSSGGTAENTKTCFRARPRNTPAQPTKVQAIPRTTALSRALFKTEQHQLITHIMLSSGLEYLDLVLVGVEMRQNSILAPAWNIPQDLTERWQKPEIMSELQDLPLNPE